MKTINRCFVILACFFILTGAAYKDNFMIAVGACLYMMSKTP